MRIFSAVVFVLSESLNFSGSIHAPVRVLRKYHLKCNKIRI